MRASDHLAAPPSMSAQARSPAEKSVTDRHVENCLLALWRWSEVKPEEVAPGLRTWKCGTQACFGGHLTTWPEFKAQGVYVASEERPYPLHPSVDARGMSPCDGVSALLFGTLDMFHTRQWLEGRGSKPDHAVVVNRLEQRIAELCA